MVMPQSGSNYGQGVLGRPPPQVGGHTGGGRGNASRGTSPMRSAPQAVQPAMALPLQSAPMTPRSHRNLPSRISPSRRAEQNAQSNGTSTNLSTPESQGFTRVSGSMRASAAGRGTPSERWLSSKASSPGPPALESPMFKASQAPSWASSGYPHIRCLSNDSRVVQHNRSSWIRCQSMDGRSSPITSCSPLLGSGHVFQVAQVDIKRQASSVRSVDDTSCSNLPLAWQVPRQTSAAKASSAYSSRALTNRSEPPSSPPASDGGLSRNDLTRTLPQSRQGTASRGFGALTTMSPTSSLRRSPDAPGRMATTGTIQKSRRRPDSTMNDRDMKDLVKVKMGRARVRTGEGNFCSPSEVGQFTSDQASEVSTDIMPRSVDDNPRPALSDIISVKESKRDLTIKFGDGSLGEGIAHSCRVSKMCKELGITVDDFVAAAQAANRVEA